MKFATDKTCSSINAVIAVTPISTSKRALNVTGLVQFLMSRLLSVNTAKWIHAPSALLTFATHILTCSDTYHIHMLPTPITINMTNKTDRVDSHIHPGVLSAFIYAQYSFAVKAWISLFTLQTQQEVAKLPFFKVRVDEALMPSADMSSLGKHCHFFVGTQSDFQFGYLAPKSYFSSPPYSDPFDSSGSEVSSTVSLTCLTHDDNFSLPRDYNEQSCISVMTHEAGCMPQHAVSSLDHMTWPHPPYKLILTSVSLTSTTSSQVSSNNVDMSLNLLFANVTDYQSPRTT